MSHVSPIPPISDVSGPRTGGYDRFGTPQDTVTPRVVPPTAGPHISPKGYGYGHPQGGPAVALPRRRSTLLAVLLAAFLGPLGLLYSAPIGALVTGVFALFLAIPLALFHAAPAAIALVTPLCVAWAFFATTAHNGMVGLVHRLAAPRW